MKGMECIEGSARYLKSTGMSHSHTRRLLSSEVETKRRLLSMKVMVLTAPEMEGETERYNHENKTQSPYQIDKVTERRTDDRTGKQKTRQREHRQTGYKEPTQR